MNLSGILKVETAQDAPKFGGGYADCGDCGPGATKS